MNDTTSAATARRKTEQAIKISASWTPKKDVARRMAADIFGVLSPLCIRGGRLTVNAAIAIDMTDPAQAARVAARVAELRKELEAAGTVHSFTTQAGSVPAGEAEQLPAEEPEGAGVTATEIAAAATVNSAPLEVGTLSVLADREAADA